MGNIADFIAGFEDFRSKAYWDSLGKMWLIGYGASYYPPDAKNKVKQGDVVTRKQALNMLTQHINIFRKDVARYVKKQLTQNQLDALTSFAYSVGIGKLASSTLLKKVNANPNDPSIRDEFLKWKYAGGKVSSWLTKRREGEADWYFGGKQTAEIQNVNQENTINTQAQNVTLQNPNKPIMPSSTTNVAQSNINQELQIDKNKPQGEIMYTAMNESKKQNKRKKQIHLSESMLSDMIARTTKKILSESSYDANGNFDEPSHNNDLRKRLDDEIGDIHTMINKKVLTLNYIGSASTDMSIKREARAAINALLKLAENLFDAYEGTEW